MLREAMETLGEEHARHPSGDPTPSAEDFEITRRLREVGELIGVHVLAARTRRRGSNSVQAT
jgi:DNA repair protein RadC